MNKIAAIVSSSVIVGLLFALAWVILWSAAFPGVWDGYEDHTVKVFVLTALGTSGVGVWESFLK